MPNILAYCKMEPGYAETSTKRWPKEPDTVMVTESDCRAVSCVGSGLIINKTAGWLAFKVKGKRRYYFQFRPW